MLDEANFVLKSANFIMVKLKLAIFQDNSANFMLDEANFIE
jgi:hypothetical protein